MKTITIKINGNLFVKKHFPKELLNYSQITASCKELQVKEGKIIAEKLITDKDLTLDGDVYVDSLIFPDNAKIILLCAGEIYHGY